VARLLLDGRDRVAARQDLRLELRRVAVRDPAKPRRVSLPEGILTANPDSVVEDPEIQIVAEQMGGIEPARTLLLRALRNGKDVVTANKALIAECGDELFRAASEHAVELMFEASVCGGIPIIRTLTEGLTANRIQSLYGILNGTTNYILTKMTEEGGSFEAMLRQAQEQGFAEPDPTFDVDGTDARQKLAILSRVAFGSAVRVEQVFREGIGEIQDQDIAFARELGYTIKLLAVARVVGERLEVRVHPAMIPSEALMANIRNEYNAVQVVGDAVGTQVFYGRGAGEMPTASAVVSDIVDVAARRCGGGRRLRSVWAEEERLAVVPMDEVVTSFYFRFIVVDRPGVLAQIARILAAEEISIESVIQHGRSADTVPLIITTHEAPERAMRRAVAEIDRLAIVREPTRVIRVERP
jgi:homoserine dehydrogenase